MSNWTNDELQAVLAEIARRASVDLDFRALAIRDSAAAITAVSGKPAPEGLTFQFVDNSGTEKVVPLPDPVPDLEELSEAELAAIAGGNDIKTGIDYKWTPQGPSGGVAVVWTR